MSFKSHPNYSDGYFAGLNGEPSILNTPGYKAGYKAGCNAREIFMRPNPCGARSPRLSSPERWYRQRPSLSQERTNGND